MNTFDMVLQAVSPYYHEVEVQEPVTPALAAYSKITVPRFNLSIPMTEAYVRTMPLTVCVLTRVYYTPNPDPEGYGDVENEHRFLFRTTEGKDFLKFLMDAKKSVHFERAYDKLKEAVSKQSKKRVVLMNQMNRELLEYVHSSGLDLRKLKGKGPRGAKLQGTP
jgi:hypothetical protein